MSVTPATEVVTRNVSDGVAVLTLNRPDRLNAWIPEMQIQYFDLLEEAAADPAVKAIVVTGAGRGFCAGADMEVLQGDAADDARAAVLRGHADYPLLDLILRARASGHTLLAAIILSGDQFPVPSQQRLRRNDSGQFVKYKSAQFLGSDR